MRTDFLVTEQSWHDHLFPIADVMREADRGVWWAPPNLPAPDGWDSESVHIFDPRRRPNPVVVAGMADAIRAKGVAIALVNHGAGQVYAVANQSYSGGPHRQMIGLYLCPSVHDAQINRAAYPHAQAVVVGCPKLDAYRSPGGGEGSGERKEPEGGTSPAFAAPTTSPGETVAFAWHWPADLTPGSGTCFLPYASAMPAVLDHLRSRGHSVIGTAHPRMAGTVEDYYRRWDVPMVSADDVFRQATLLVADNTSLAWEFMSLDRPVVWLDGPRWGEEYGKGQWPRFAEPVEGGMVCPNPRELPPTIDRAIADPTDQKRKRQRAIKAVYAFTDSFCSQRAADAIVEWAKTAQPTSKPYQHGKG